MKFMTLRETNKQEIDTNRNFPPDKLPINIIRQGNTFLCWAACTAMILDHQQRLNGQRLCQIASKGLGMTPDITCCRSSSTNSSIRSDCDEPICTDDIESIWQVRFIINSTPVERIRKEDIIDEIKLKKRPVMLGFSPEPNQTDTGHVVLVYGYQELGGGKLNILWHDPSGGSISREWRDLTRGRWSLTWWQITG
jgi:hypothetical protein